MERKVDGAMGTAADELVEALAVEDGGPEAATLVFRLMAHNQEFNAAQAMSLYEGEVAAHERTKEMLRDARAHLHLIRHRHAFMCGDVDTLNPWDEDLR